MKLRMGLGRNIEDGDHYADMGIMIFVSERCNHGHSLACIICPWRPNTWEKVAWLQLRVSSMLVPLKRDTEGRWGKVRNGEQNRKRENKTNRSGAYLQSWRLLCLLWCWMLPPLDRPAAAAAAAGWNTASGCSCQYELLPTQIAGGSVSAWSACFSAFNSVYKKVLRLRVFVRGSTTVWSAHLLCQHCWWCASSVQDDSPLQFQTDSVWWGGSRNEQSQGLICRFLSR